MYQRVTNDGWRVTKLRHGFLWEMAAPPANEAAPSYAEAPESKPPFQIKKSRKRRLALP
jgi:hypothetical protein